MIPFQPGPSGTPSPSPLVTISAQVGVPGWADSWPSWAQWLVGRPLQIALTIAIGLLVWRVVHRLIDHWSEAIASGQPWSKRTHWGRRIARTEVGSLFADASPLASDRRKQRARTIGSMLRSASTAVIGLIVLVMVLDDIGINTAALLASAGIAGIAVGFGAQSLVKDLLSGTFMLLEDQYGVGDVIDVGEASGTVEEVGLRVTKIRDASGTLWFVPNGEIRRVGNRTQGWAKAVVEVRLPFGEDLPAAREVMLAVAHEVADTDEYKDSMLSEPTLDGLEDLAGNGMLLRLQVRTKPADQWTVARELRLRIAEEFQQRGISLTLPLQPPPPGAAPPGAATGR